VLPQEDPAGASSWRAEVNSSPPMRSCTWIRRTARAAEQPDPHWSTLDPMVIPGPDPDGYPPIDPSEPVPDDPGELSPDTPETLPPAPVEPMPGPDDPDSIPGTEPEPAAVAG
jgi:hypothetical protein